MSSIKLMAVGDIMLGDFPACYGFGVASTLKKYGMSHPWAHLRKIFEPADLRFGNLEAVHSSAGRNPLWLPSLYMRGEKHAIPALREVGFDVVAVANNHMMQHGERAFNETKELLESNGIEVCGAIEDGTRQNLLKLQQGNILIGFLGYSMRPEEYRPDSVLYCLASETEILGEIREARNQVDLLIVSVHWGDEYVSRPSGDQVRLGREFVGAGADVILGHHPHVLQGIERIEKAIIAYSLGNCVFDMWLPETRRSVVLELELSKHGVENHHVHPTYINDAFQPEPLNTDDIDEFNEMFQGLCDSVKEEISETEYSRLVTDGFRTYRSSVAEHYRKSLFRFNPFYFAQMCFLIALRRFTRLHI